MNVSFYYKNSSDTYPETFQVGYSTIESPSLDDFNWGEEVTAHDQDHWKLYKEFFPIGTKYVAVKLISDDMFHLYLDNFSFEPASCADEDKCELTFTLTDNYNDSWNGNAIRVVDEESNTVLADMTNVGNYNTETHTLAVCDGRQLRFEWVTGEWPEECSYTVTDINGDEVFSGEGAMSGPVSFTPDCTPIFIFNGNWNNGSNWNIGEVPQAGKDVAVKAAAIIPGTYCAHVGTIDIQEGGSLTINDGGQLIHSNPVMATVKKDILGYDTEVGGWNFITTPIAAGTTPSIDNGLLDCSETSNYDLYYYDEPTHHWRNQKQHDLDIQFQFLSNGQGYLYAHSNAVELTFAGVLQAGDQGTYTVDGLSHSADKLTGFNLVGNPFACNAIIDRPAYVINGNTVVAYQGAQKVLEPCEGVMVQADAKHESVTFTKVIPGAQTTQAHPRSLQIVLSQAVEPVETPARYQEGVSTSSTTLLDNAIITFNEGSQLGKFYFGEQNANIYLPQGGEEYAIAYSDKQGEIPLNFKANENGTYTISVNPENVELSYLHLIDNMTGADVDLLSTQNVIAGEDPKSLAPSYTFTAKTTDYESRFKLVFAANKGAANDDDANFAFFSNGNWIIANEGKATLQVIDINGRILSNETVNGSVSKAINAAPGVYMLRLISGDNVKTQKIVVR